MFLTETIASTLQHHAPLPDGSLDLARFPIVEMGEARHSGYAFAWSAAMRRVLARRVPFTFLDNFASIAETEADRRARRCWFISNAPLLQDMCRGYIAVEPDIARRADARAAVLGLLGQEGEQAQRPQQAKRGQQEQQEQKGLRVMVVSNVIVAQQLARVLLTTDAQPGTPAGPTRTPRRQWVSSPFHGVAE